MQISGHICMSFSTKNTVFFFQKQVAQFAKVVSHVWEIISKGREDWEGESMRAAGWYFLINAAQIKISRLLKLKQLYD